MFLSSPALNSLREMAWSVLSIGTVLSDIAFVSTDLEEMKKLLLVEEHPLMRLGLHTILNRVSDRCEIISVDIGDIEKLADLAWAADLVVLGLPADPDECHEAMTIVDELLRPERMLLLSESAASWDPADGASPASVYACIEKKSSIDTFIAAVQLGMRDTTEHPEPVGPALRKEPCPLPLDASDYISECDAAHSRLPVAQAWGQPDANANVEIPGRFASALTPKTASPSSGHSKANIGNNDRLCLTQRQRQVLELLAHGHPIKTVARMLKISPSTAKSHASSLYRQLNVNSKDEAVYAAHQLGILLH